MIIIPAGIGKIGLSTNHAKALIINTKSSYEELAKKIMEIFEYKEKYDEI